MRRVVVGLRFSVAGVLLAAASGMAGAAEIAPQDRRSGADFMSAESRATQADDAANPGMLWVLDGERLSQAPAGASAKSCADCHGAAQTSMRGVAARYPAFDARANRPVDLAGRINLCRTGQQNATVLVRDGQDLLALTAYVAHQSRGLPVTPEADARLVPFRENGRRLFERRMGQLDLACASCHDDNWRGRLGGSPITQGQPNGYPIYRLEWQALGSLQRRMRNCMVGVRAEPYDLSAPEYVDLELYLMSRATGLPMEAPAVRP
ncbi:MAG: sulfur oxidation c-type cytochrome SoxA [Rhizobiales bacterium 12-66-7]|jgi:sulfur-oxidizing protein SoxA|nr:MAG: sulfur oxidation c-type cytochrome SoxA [Rhizobiales bacterium 12-66-7]OZB05431.1 MAG: sulfur oxidation c-type cytochrome SoxA [Rhizobiales bacterium 39-66-18]